MLENKNNVLVAIDFETANSNPLSACSVGLVVFKSGEVIFEYESLIKPPKKYDDFNYYNTKIHNIEAEDVVSEKNWGEIFPILKPYFNNATIVAHNAAFDTRVLAHLNKYYKINSPIIEYYCTVELSRKIMPYLDNHRLNTVSDHLDIVLNHHDAKSDAMACALIVYKCMIITESESLVDMFRSANMHAKTINNIKSL